MPIREATAEDYAGILRIYNQSVLAGGVTGDEKTLSLDERRPWLALHDGRHYCLFVAEEAGSILGYLALSPYRHGRSAFYNTAEISYYIAADSRRQGLASQLMTHALKACSSLEIHSLIAILLAGNDASIRLLEKHGFREWGRMPRIGRLQSGIVDHLYYGRHVGEPD